MPLHLILGPSGAHKVGKLLDAHEAASRAGQTAWFVVPGSADVERFQRELAGLDGPPGVPRRAGVPFGAVMSVGQLERRLLARFGNGEELLSREHRRAVALSAIHDTALTALAPAQRSQWLDEELIRLAEELSASGDRGGRAEAGLRAWSASTSDSRGRELADLLEADAATLARLATGASGTRHVDRAASASIVAGALHCGAPSAADLHVVLAGFDDLDPVQRALVLALARSAAHVIVSLPFEEGREALAAARPLVDELRAAASNPEYLRAEASRGDPALDRLAQGLYETAVYVAPPTVPERDPFAPLLAEATNLGPLIDYDDPSAALPPEQPFAEAAAPSPTSAAREQTPETVIAPVLELRGGGPDEEAALIAEHIVTRIRGGCEPERIAVVVAQPDARGPALEAALRRAGVPAHLVAQRHARVWPSVAAIVALLRALAPGGEARHLVAWVAGPGGPGVHHAFDAMVRRRGGTAVRDAFRVWASLGNERMAEVEAINAAVRGRKRDRFVVDQGIDGAVTDVTTQEAPQSLEAVVAQLLRTRLGVALSRINGRPTPDEERDVRAVGGILSVLDGLVELGRQAPELGLGLEELATLIERARAPREVEPPGSVAVVSPLDVRTRYPEVVILARAVRGTYPGNERIRQLLARADRAALSTHHGWAAPAQPEHAAAERYLAYEVVARPSRQLVMAWHNGNGDGKPVEPSPLLEEIRRVAAGDVPIVELPSGAAARRAVTRDRRERLADARRGPRHREPVPAQSPLLAAQVRDRYAVGELQTASRCAAQWFVNHHLRPQPLSPDAAPLTAGRMRHEVLREVVSSVVIGGQPLGPDAVPALRDALAESAQRLAEQGAVRKETQAERLMRERVVAEVDATLPGLCGDEQLSHQPDDFELPFGTGAGLAEPGDADAAPGDDEAADDARPPVTIERAGERLVLSGRIDRLDRGPGGELVVVDYKGANVDPFKGATWADSRELQAGLYALAAEQLMGEGSHTVASLYQPVPGPANQPPRGATSADLPGRRGLLRNDRLDPADWDALLDELVRLAAEAQRGIDDGIVRPEPTRCSTRGCRYPWLCREVTS